MKNLIPVQTCLLALAISTFALGVQISQGSFSFQYVGLRFPAPTGWYLATDSEVAEGLQEGAQIVGLDSPQAQAVVEQMPGKVLVWVSEQPPDSEFEGINRNILVAAIDVRDHRDEFASGADFLEAGSQAMKESLPEVEISEVSIQRLGGEDFHKLELLLPAGEMTIHQWQLALIQNDYLVILNLSAESSSGLEELFQISDGLSLFEVSQEIDSSAEGQSFRSQAAIVFPPSSGSNLLRTGGIVLMILGVIWFITSLSGSKRRKVLCLTKERYSLPSSSRPLLTW